MKKNLVVTLISLFIALLIAEVAVRIVAPVDFKRDERNILYRYDADLGWFGKSNIEEKFAKAWAPRKIMVKNNSLGFRDVEFKDDPEKKNVVFLGDSYIWGYDVEQDERFTEKLRKKTDKYDFYNLGVSGYGTDQEFLLLKKYFDKFKPDVVFLTFCTNNDHEDNVTNMRYGGYLRPYFEYEDGKLNLKGTPVPFTNNYKLADFYKKHKILYRSHIVKNIAIIIENKKSTAHKQVFVKDPTVHILAEMNEFIKGKGAKFVLTSTEYSAVIDEFAKKNGVDYIDLSTNLRYKKRGAHWTPKGHDFVSDKIMKYLNQ